MITVQEATAIIRENLYHANPVAVSITDAVGRVLAENIIADRDFPAFDRVAMDGIAIDFNSWKEGSKGFAIEYTQAAGQPAYELQDANNCIEVMTGAVLPLNTDTVVPYENITIKGAEATINSSDIQRFQNIHRRGSDAREKDVLVEKDMQISAAEVALMATVGLKHVNVYDLPSAAIVATGDELVEIDQVPQPHQIRQSNSYALHAAMKALSWPVVRYHIPDNEDFARASLTTILVTHEVIILSGGISKGKFDYVPSMLEQLGVTKMFHGVRQRPGKPFWFGRTSSGKTVFALPGNPVSTFLCFYRYVQPWLRASLGLPTIHPKVMLGENFRFEPALTYFLQVRVVNEGARLIAYPAAGGGSGDFVNLAGIDGFIELAAERSTFEAGELFDLISFR
ncbi:MAG TPA: molybdopterin molybdotransferase MoeA [Chryseosolibacter sp.]|nr:molybdopterin molybdotransferase MoeA [Chryseosolibacter sp.]